MRLPNLLYGNNKVRQQMVAFGGLNYSENHAEGEFESMRNLSSRRFPALCPRPGRTVARECTGAPSALYAWDKLAVVEGTDFIYDGVVKGTVSAGPKQMYRVGDYIVIWPDKKYYNFAEDRFTALDVGFDVPWYNGVSIHAGSRYIQIPETAYEFVKDEGAAETVVSGPWLGVRTDLRNETITVRWWEVSTMWGGYQTRTITPEELANVLPNGPYGWPVLTESETDAGRYSSCTHEPKEYMPGKLREYYTFGISHLKNEEYVEDTWTHYWGTTQDADILDCPMPDTLEDVQRTGRSATSVSTYEIDRLYTCTVKGYEGTIVNYGALEVGDVLNYNAETGTGDMVTAIDRTYYTDHWCAASYTTVPCTWTLMHTYESFTTQLDTLGIAVGVKVRVTRGDKSVTTTVQSIADRKVTFADSLSAISGVDGTIYVDRVTDPDLDFVCAHDNRLWGVAGRKIYASKYDDPQNFETGTGNDDDAWWAEVGSGGDFTGIVSYSGSVLAFKENMVHKVLGDLPSDFTVSTYSVAGIQPGSHASAQIINEVLYYKGTNGVYAYNGYTPQLVSTVFGERRFREAVGGTDGAKYWVSMLDEAGQYVLLCYDPATGLWMQEDELHVTAFSLYQGKCYAAAYEEDRIYTLDGETAADMPWEAVTVPFYEGSFDRKLYTKMLVRAELPEGSVLKVEASYDGKPWVELYNTRAPRWRVAILPVRPRRCDSMRLRFSGTGDVTLQGVAREVLTGSER